MLFIGIWDSCGARHHPSSMLRISISIVKNRLRTGCLSIFITIGIDGWFGGYLRATISQYLSQYVLFNEWIQKNKTAFCSRLGFVRALARDWAFYFVAPVKPEFGRKLFAIERIVEICNDQWVMLFFSVFVSLFDALTVQLDDAFFSKPQLLFQLRSWLIVLSFSLIILFSSHCERNRTHSSLGAILFTQHSSLITGQKRSANFSASDIYYTFVAGHDRTSPQN